VGEAIVDATVAMLEELYQEAPGGAPTPGSSRRSGTGK
jgi:hypothetical protein